MNQKTNVLWINLDHVTFRHYKKTSGAKPVLDTYETLASQGIEFAECRSVCPLCVPARASMLTGLLPSKHGAVTNGAPKVGYDVPTLGEYLTGYRCGYYGKDHSFTGDLSKRGFEGYYPEDYGNPYMTAEYGAYLAETGLEAPIYHQEWSVGVPLVPAYESGKDYDLTKINNQNNYSSGYIKTPGPVHEVDFLVHSAEKFLNRAVGDDTPFFLRMDTWGPHHAWQPPFDCGFDIPEEKIEEYPSFNDEKFGGRPDWLKGWRELLRSGNTLKAWPDWRRVVKRAYEQYSYIDRAAGRLIALLDKLGLTENTLVIYSADHGDTLASHGGLVDKYGEMSEELMHIPLVMRLPGTIKAGIKHDGYVSNLDIPATILDVLGISPTVSMDSVSLVPAFNGENPRANFTAQSAGHFDNHTIQRAVYQGEYKALFQSDGANQLYNIVKDPFELDCLYDNPEYAAVVSTMREMAGDISG